MRHTEEAARRFERLADRLDPATAAVDDLSDPAGYRRGSRPRPPGRGSGHRTGDHRPRSRAKLEPDRDGLGVSRQAALPQFASKVG
jgi:hypothetical protein